MKTLFISIKLFFLMTILTGVIYPGFVWCVGEGIFPWQVHGSLVTQRMMTDSNQQNSQQKIIGSELLGQKITLPKYFWGRPSAVDNNSASSGASNLGPTSADLLKIVNERETELHRKGIGDAEKVPQDLLFASASGLDPHISMESADIQCQRIAKERGLDISTLRQLVKDLTEAPQYGIFGEYRVNVLKLNMALDQLTLE